MNTNAICPIGKSGTKKEEHTHPTRGRYLSSMHLTWVVVVGVIVIGAR